MLACPGVAVNVCGAQRSQFCGGETVARRPSQSRAFPPGSHEVQVWLKDGGRARQEVTVKSADVTDVELRITPGLVARGHVDDRQGRPASAVRVIATTDVGREAELQPHHNYVCPRRFQRRSPTSPGALSLRASRKDDGLALSGPQPTQPGATVNVNLRLGEGARVTGIVRTQDGSPAPGVRNLIPGRSLG